MTPAQLGGPSLGCGTGLETRFSHVIQDIAALSWGLMAVGDASMLALAVPSDGWSQDLPILLWDRHLAPSERASRDLCTAATVGPALDALCVAADELFHLLQAAGICPSAGRGFSIFTDGTGVALTAEHPVAATADAGWLIELAGGQRGAATVLPMAKAGVWTLLHADPADARLH